MNGFADGSQALVNEGDLAAYMFFSMRDLAESPYLPETECS
jgi:hypothetical protein